jgi:uncharacterized protein involved in exopolysaccharide biosynthesis
MGDLTVSDYANGMPNIRLGEMFKSFFKQLPWVIILFVIGAIIAWKATADFKRTFTGDGRILVQFSDDYAYNPVGQSGQNTGLSQTIDTITLTEAAIMKNGEIIDNVVAQIGPNKIAPDAWKKVEKARRANNTTDEDIALMELRNEVGDAYRVMPRAKASVIDVVFKHEDANIAVQATNAFIDEYIAFRRTVFVEGKDEIISERREVTEGQLNANERAIARFLKKNDISDFDSEKEGLQERTEGLKEALNGTRASMSETEAALAIVEDQLRNTPETINLYKDDISAQRVAQAELELRQLLAKYLPTSNPVRQKQTELNELLSLRNSYGGEARGGRRVGPNPTHQALMTQRNNLATTADSLREREFTLQKQLNSADGKVRRLTALSPEFQNLLRERETLKTRLDSYNAKEQEALVDAAQAADQAENVKVISYAKYPGKGRNMRLIMFLVACVAWGLILFFIAMIRVFLDPRLYSSPSAARQRSVMDDAPAIQPVAQSAWSPDPIPEAVPAYEPLHPAGPTPYDIPAAQYPAAEGQGQYAYSQPGYASTSQATPYAPSASYDAYSQPMQSAYQTPEMDAQNTIYHGSAALDIAPNPYASGAAKAGGFGAQANLDAYGRPIEPQS